AVRRSLSLVGEFRYHYADPTTGEVWRRKTLKRDRRIFAFYKSMESTETEKHKSVPLHFIFVTGALFVCAAAVFGWRFLGWYGSSDAFSRSFLSHNPSAVVSDSRQKNGKTGPLVNKGTDGDLPAKVRPYSKNIPQALPAPSPVPASRARIVGTLQTENSR